MNILGISGLAHESTVSLVRDNALVAAVSEERLTRVKNQGGFPYRSLDMVLDLGGIRAEDVDLVAHPFFTARQELDLQVRCLKDDLAFTLANGEPLTHRLIHVLNYLRITYLAGDLGPADRALEKGLAERGLLGKLQRVDHQLAHVASAVFTSGFDRCLGVSLDGYGSGAAGSVYSWEAGKLGLLGRIPFPHSLGAFYQRATTALGFTALRHEGKVLGLAAFGDPAVLHDRVRARFEDHGDFFRFKSAHDFLIERGLARRYRREDIAAAYQKVLEEVTTRFLTPLLLRTGHTRVALAGGVASNVKLNQRIAEIPGVEAVFVHPAMSDMGSGTGAALMLASARDGLKPFAMRDAYLGPAYSEREMEEALRRGGLPFRKSPDLAKEVAGLLAAGKVVARFDGRMEYGPRSLGNRSILYPAKDPDVNRWLNQRLRRTEFMPFAPIVLAEHAPALFVGLGTAAHAAEFMTLTFDCTDRMKAESPAAVHVDGTARPQLLRREVNPWLHGMLSEYHRFTGLPVLINTSFNMHEEPIVCTPDDAVKGFLDSRLDCLAMGDFLAELPHG